MARSRSLQSYPYRARSYLLSQTGVEVAVGEEPEAQGVVERSWRVEQAARRH